MGGADGGGGQQTDGRPTCAELETSYANALPAARRCEVNGLKQCQQPVSSTLSTCPGCTTYVNDNSALTAIRASWAQAGCGAAVGISCPLIACLQPTAGVCSATDGGSGRCGEVYGTLPPVQTN